VQGRSRRYNFSTDAGHRFERGVDGTRTVVIVEHITALVQQICGGDAGPLDDQTLGLPAATPVRLRAKRAARVVGMPISVQQCAEVFTRMGLQFTQQGDELTVRPPPWRFDLKIEEDLIEEVIRVIGFNALPATPPVAPVVPRVRREAQRSPHRLRRDLAALGYHETIGFSFVEARWEQELAGNPDPIRVLNPIATPLAVMRSSLVGSLVQVLRHNLARRADRVRVFELGRVFLRSPEAPAGPLAVAGVEQPMRVAGLAFGPVEVPQWGLRERLVDFFDVKGDVEALLAPRKPVFEPAEHPALHPGRCARVLLDGRAVGFVGELHPRWRQAYELPQPPMLFELDLAEVLPQPLPAYHAVPRQQGVRRDLAVVVRDSVAHDRVMAALQDDPSGLVRAAMLFDVYKPGGQGAGLAADERSLAVRLELLDPQATLTEDRIEAAVAQALARAQAACGARLRA